MTTQKNTLKVPGEEDVELCYKLASTKDGITGLPYPTEEMRKART